MNLLRRSLLALLILKLWVLGAVGGTRLRVLGMEISYYCRVCKIIVYKKKLSKYKKCIAGVLERRLTGSVLVWLAVGFFV